MIIFLILQSQFAEGQIATNGKSDAVKYVLSLNETEKLFRICEYGADTIRIVSEKIIFTDTLQNLQCDKVVLNRTGTRLFNSPNDKSTKSELYVYRIDELKEMYKIFIMHPFSHYTVTYSVRRNKGHFKLVDIETGWF